MSLMCSETSAGLAEIVVDEDIGEIHVPRYASAADVGYVINRVAAEGQDEGAAIKGLRTRALGSAGVRGLPVGQRDVDRLFDTAHLRRSCCA